MFIWYFAPMVLASSAFFARARGKFFIEKLLTFDSHRKRLLESRLQAQRSVAFAGCVPSGAGAANVVETTRFRPLAFAR